MKVTCDLRSELLKLEIAYCLNCQFQLLKLEIHCEDHISPSYISAALI